MPQQPTPAAAAPAKPQPPKPPAEFQENEIGTAAPATLLAILKDPAAPVFRKAKACVRAGELGVKEAVPALSVLLADPQLSAYARYGLEPIPDPSADEALRSALPKLKGDLLLGVVSSLGKRRDAQAVPALVKMMHSPDPGQARAAASALGHIGSLAAAKDLRSALAKIATGPVRPAVADACLVCAERLLAAGHRAEALDLYAALSAPGIPKPMRMAAMAGIIREETSIARPK